MISNPRTCTLNKDFSQYPMENMAENLLVPLCKSVYNQLRFLTGKEWMGIEIETAGK